METQHRIGTPPSRHRPRRSPAGLRRTLVLLIVLALAPMVLVELASDYRQFRERRAAELRLDAEAARGFASAFDLYQQEARRDAQTVGRAFVLPPVAPRPRWNDILSRWRTDYPTIRWVRWVDLSGAVLAATRAADVGRSVAAEPWFAQLPSGPGWLVTDAAPPLSPDSGTFLLVQAVPDETGRPHGYMVACVDPGKLGAQLSLHTMGSRSYSIVDRNGRLVYRFPGPLPPPRDRDFAARYPSLLEALRRREARLGVGYDPFHRERHLFAIAPIRSLGWAVAVAHPEAEVTAPIWRGLLEDLAVVTLVALISLLAALVVARRVAVPVERLSDFALAVGRGQFPTPVAPEGPREIRTLIDAFDRMAVELAARQTEHERVLQLEREKARDARLLEAIVEHTLPLIAYFDRDLRFLKINEPYCRRLRRPREEIIGRTYSEVSESADVLELLRQVLDRGEAVERREVVRRATQRPPEGLTYWDVAVVPVLDEEGRVSGLVLSAMDVTQQVLARELRLSAERTRAEMAEIVARETNHRTKNNLALISGILQLQLQNQPPDSAAAVALRDAIARVSALATVHQQLYAGQPNRANVRDMLQRLSDTVAGALGGDQVQVSADSADVYLPAKVASMLAVVANEMLTNAIKHGGPGPDGKLHIAVSFQVQPEQACLSVRNSGKPVAADFDPTRAEGLGLRLIADAAAHYGGTFALRPQPEGTECLLCLSTAALEPTYTAMPAADWHI